MPDEDGPSTKKRRNSQYISCNVSLVLTHFTQGVEFLRAAHGYHFESVQVGPGRMPLHVSLLVTYSRVYISINVYDIWHKDNNGGFIIY
jgi:hypothetical protein